MASRSAYCVPLELSASFRGAGMLLPSFIRSQTFDNDECSALKRRPSSAALDGLRGIAALLVFLFHILFSYTDLVEYGYGRDDRNTHLIQLPFLRVLFAGHAMVSVFFVVGGYVFSLRPLRLMRSRSYDRLFESVSSSLFRRGIRLYLPAVVATFFTMLAIHAGLWEYPRQYTDNPSYIFYADHHHQRFPTLSDQFHDWVGETWKLTNVWDYYNKGFVLPYYNAYNPHLWTVPFEYRSSLFLVILLIAFSKCRPPLRCGFLLCTIYFCGMWDRWEMVLFLSGTMLAETHLICESPPLDSASMHGHRPSSRASGCSSSTFVDTRPCSPVESKVEVHHWSFTGLLESTKYRKWAVLGVLNVLTPELPGGLQRRHLVLLIASLYLLSTPNLDIVATPGYQYLATWTPNTYTDDKRFLQGLGAILLVYTVSSSESLQRPLTSRFALYLGRLSYSLYIIHGPMIHMVGYSVTPYIWSRIGMEGTRWWVGLVGGSVVLAICVFWVADIFESQVDRRAGIIARKLENWATGGHGY